MSDDGAAGPARALEFRPFDPARVVFEDDDLLVVDKPARVPSQAVDPELPDDLPHRLRLFLRERGARSDYLGTHQRLDQETSGLVLFTRRRSANPAVASAFESRTVEKRYVAAVEGTVSLPETLRHWLRPADGGGSEVVAPGTRGAKEAVTRVLGVRREGARALVELRIETGRTHQIRAQLAHEGLLVAGDGRYGGAREASAPRLLLHATELRIAHPATSSPMTFRSEPPPVFERWLTGAPIAFPEPATTTELLRDAVEARWGLGTRARADGKTTAFRLVHGAGDGLPGLAVDFYDGFLVAHLYRALSSTEEAAVLDALDALGAKGVYVKHRPLEAQKLDPAALAEIAPADPVRGLPAPDPFVVFEHGVGYEVRLGDGLSTGLFLEHRENRHAIASLAPGKRVLNLFAYTCGFALAAASERAASTTSVDVAQRALHRGEDAFRRAGISGDHRFVREDVFEFLRRAIAAGDLFDVVVCDPPTFATTRESRFVSSRDTATLAELVFRIVRPGGAVLFGTNDERFSWTAFRRSVGAGARAAGVALSQLKDRRPPPDYPAGPGAEPHPKAVLARVGMREGRVAGPRPTKARPQRFRA